MEAVTVHKVVPALLVLWSWLWTTCKSKFTHSQDMLFLKDLNAL